jgi:hypothetical protein
MVHPKKPIAVIAVQMRYQNRAVVLTHTHTHTHTRERERKRGKGGREGGRKGGREAGRDSYVQVRWRAKIYTIKTIGRTH